ncbi:MAG TPA: glycoside hydrolase family 27 protein [Anaerohalosphaeraceae bacterium]|nr:glycoside hydrolase family 27 protein [Anaerohalosphaeraceae bacterium]HOL87955.1 glycoside hydrolase family 27 protein [Anaerohalosphaeraceae bacterium]HPP55454.1 glycoside hydrolase family 27 protein [Anaerohalosphaeraceae bacterium]
MKTVLPVFFVCGLLSITAAQKFEGLAPTPPMGWNTWNTFAGNISESLIKETAQAMIDSGMQKAGYIYIIIDDCWSAKERDANGNLIADPAKFPSGMKALGDWLHEKGFKFGIYGCAGRKTCGGYPGGRGHEFQDARTYASWGVDYLKYDWCETGTADARETYKIMRDALYAAGRPIVFSMCEWGQNKPWEWAQEVAHLWRTTGDIGPCWDCKPKKEWENSIKSILDRQVGLEKYAGPDHWNDPDMLQVGCEGLSLEESRSHFTLWCILAAPLIAGNDVRNMNPEIRDILTCREAIAVNQDPLGKQGFRVFCAPEKEIWAKELSNGDWAVCLLNPAIQPAEMTLPWKDLTFLKGTFRVRNIWSKKDLGTTEETFRGKIAPHGVAFFRLSPITP